MAFSKEITMDLNNSEEEVKRYLHSTVQFSSRLYTKEYAETYMPGSYEER